MNIDEKERMSLLKKVIQADGDIHQHAKILNQLEWDFNGTPALLDKQTLKDVLERFAVGTSSVNYIYEWADFLELRDDVDFPEDDKEKISQIMRDLANPDLQGGLTLERAKKFISQLS